MILLLQLFLAHIIGDFFLQPDSWVKDKAVRKWRSPFLYLHTAIHFALIMIITANPSLWPQALAIALIHLLIDGIKLSFQNTNTQRTWFFIDQLLHLLTIIAIWLYQGNMPASLNLLYDKNTLTLLTAVLFLWRPASFIVKTAISKWSPGNNMSATTVSVPSASNTDDSLESAGQWIGTMERLLVFVFVLLGKWEGIGFLLTAKSVFRFGDLKDARDKKLTEYVLIGTLLSFGIALAAGLIVLKLRNSL